MTDMSSDAESYDGNQSPMRRVQKLIHSSAKVKPRRKKKMPPELKIIKAPTSDSPYHSDHEKALKCRRPRSVSMFNETIEKPRLNPASWHQFKRLPPAKCLSEIKTRSNQPSELQVKLTTLKRNVWTGVQSEEKGPLSWGISSFAMNSYFTDSEALLRSCSKKLEELEGEQQKVKDDKKKKKSKTKKLTLKVPNSMNEILEPMNKLPKPWKKKGKLKNKSESSPYQNNTSFTDIPRNTQSGQKAVPAENRQAKSRFKKGAIVTTAVQSKKHIAKANIISDNSDSDNSIQLTKKVKKKTKSVKTKFCKAISENKSKN